MAFKTRSIIVMGAVFGLLVSCFLVLVTVGSLNIHSGCDRATCHYEKIIEVHDTCFLVAYEKGELIASYPIGRDSDEYSKCTYTRSINDNTTLSAHDFACYIYRGARGNTYSQYPLDHCFNSEAFIMLVFGTVIPVGFIAMIIIGIIGYYPKDVNEMLRCGREPYVFAP